MRTVSCFICGSDQKKTVYEQRFKDRYLELINPVYQSEPRSLVVCQGCGFVYHDPQLDQSDITVLYSRYRDDSFRNESPNEYFDRITSLPKGESENYAKSEWLCGAIPDFMKKGGRLLDIGCGGGTFLRTFLENNPAWTACGVESTPLFAELARRRLNLPVMKCSYQSGLFPKQRFELISINQVLEHVLDPVAFLQDMRNDLAGEGYVYLEVPDILDLSHLPPEHDRFSMPHLWVFSESSLTNVCRRAGYEIRVLEHQVTVRHKRNLVVLLTKQTSDPDPDVWLRDDPQGVLLLRRQYYEAAQGSEDKVRLTP